MLLASEGILSALRFGACRYRSLGGHSLRALRLDLELAVLHYLQDLPSNKWACEEEEATEVLTHLISFRRSLIITPYQTLSAKCSPSNARRKARYLSASLHG